MGIFGRLYAFFHFDTIFIINLFPFRYYPCSVHPSPAPPLSQTSFFTKQNTKLTFNQTLAQLAGALAAVFVALASVMNKLEKMFYDETGADVSFYRIGMEGGGPFSIMHDGRAALAVMCICEIVTHCFVHEHLFRGWSDRFYSMVASLQFLMPILFDLHIIMALIFFAGPLLSGESLTAEELHEKKRQEMLDEMKRQKQLIAEGRV